MALDYRRGLIKVVLKSRLSVEPSLNSGNTEMDIKYDLKKSVKTKGDLYWSGDHNIRYCIVDIEAISGLRLEECDGLWQRGGR